MTTSHLNWHLSLKSSPSVHRYYFIFIFILFNNIYLEFLLFRLSFNHQRTVPSTIDYKYFIINSNML